MNAQSSCGVDGGLRLTPNPPYAIRTVTVMPNYRRVFVEGGCWFFTVNLEDRRSRLLTEHIGALRAAIVKVRRRQPFDINAWVVLPDHMHAIWTLPPGDSDFPTRWRLIKTFFARALPPDEWRSEVHKARRERGIWQRRYWEHLIRDERDYMRQCTTATSTLSSMGSRPTSRIGLTRRFTAT